MRLCLDEIVIRYTAAADCASAVPEKTEPGGEEEAAAVALEVMTLNGNVSPVRACGSFKRVGCVSSVSAVLVLYPNLPEESFCVGQSVSKTWGNALHLQCGLFVEEGRLLFFRSDCQSRGANENDVPSFTTAVRLGESTEVH